MSDQLTDRLIQQIEQYASVGASIEDVLRVLSIQDMQGHPQVLDHYRRGQALGRIKIQARLMQEATSGDNKLLTAMALSMGLMVDPARQETLPPGELRALAAKAIEHIERRSR